MQEDLALYERTLGTHSALAPAAEAINISANMILVLCTGITILPVTVLQPLSNSLFNSDWWRQRDLDRLGVSPH
jgi:uncharacterized membrane protein